MAQLFVPLTGAFRALAGSGFNTRGENLDRPLWRGAEIGSLDTLSDVWGAVSEAEFHDWIIGVHHPLYRDGGPAPCRFFDPDPIARGEALDLAAAAAQAAHHVGARYIVFRFPWPGLTDAPADPFGGWTEARAFEVSRRAFERFARIQSAEQIKVVLEIDGPNRFFFDRDLFSDLCAEFPELSLCIDTGRLGLLARSYGRDPVELCRRWLPWVRHVHLHTSLWDGDGGYRDHIPTDATHTAGRWPGVTPAADLAAMIMAAQPRCTVVLEHDPRSVSSGELEAAHAWAAALVGEGL